MPELVLVNNTYIYSGNQPLYLIQDQSYAQAIFTKAEALVGKAGLDKGLALLAGLPNLMPGKVKKVGDLELIQIKAQAKMAAMGQDYRCNGCSKKFFDVNKTGKCPKCGTPIGKEPTGPTGLSSR